LATGAPCSRRFMIFLTSHHERSCEFRQIGRARVPLPVRQFGVRAGAIPAYAVYPLQAGHNSWGDLAASHHSTKGRERARFSRIAGFAAGNRRPANKQGSPIYSVRGWAGRMGSEVGSRNASGHLDCDPACGGPLGRSGAALRPRLFGTQRIGIAKRTIAHPCCSAASLPYSS
jgi:hypothetical protein